MSRPSSPRGSAYDQFATGENPSLPHPPQIIGFPHPSSVGFAFVPARATGSEDGTAVADPTIQHQQRRTGYNLPSQDRLRVLGESIYPQSSHSPTHSHPRSTSSYTGNSLVTGEPSPSASTGISRSRKTEVSLKPYDPRTQEVIQYARALTLKDMVKEIGWLYTKSDAPALHTNIRENYLGACEKLNRHVVPFDEKIESYIGAGLKLVRAQIVKFAETYAQECLTCPHPEINDNREALIDWKKGRVKELIDQKNPTNFFLHEKDDNGNVIRYFGNSIFERFHISFWYTHHGSPIPRFKSSYQTTPIPMLALSAAALLCALEREASGLKYDRGTTLKFKGDVYGRWFDCYNDGMKKLLDHNVLGKEFSERLESLHKNGLEMLATRSGGHSRDIPEPVFIPDSVQASVTPSESTPSESTPFAFGDFIPEGQDYSTYEFANDYGMY